MLCPALCSLPIFARSTFDPYVGPNVERVIATGLRDVRPTSPRRAIRKRRNPADRPERVAGTPHAPPRTQPRGTTNAAIATKCASAAAITKTWKSSWKPKIAGRGSGRRRM